MVKVITEPSMFHTLSAIACAPIRSLRLMKMP
jgi:hypothetical protein